MYILKARNHRVYEYEIPVFTLFLFLEIIKLNFFSFFFLFFSQLLIHRYYVLPVVLVGKCNEN